MSKIAVVFDLDDTLYSERNYVFSGFQAVSVYLNKTTGYDAVVVYERLTAAFVRNVRGCTFNIVLDELGLVPNEEQIRDLVEVYRSHMPVLGLYPDAKCTIERLRPYAKLGLLTDGFVESQRKKVQSLGIESWFDQIVYTDDIGHDFWKPSPVPFQRISRQLKVNPERSVYVGDNPDKDFIGARGIGMKTVRVVRPDTEHGHKTPGFGYEADHEVNTLGEVPEYISGCFSIPI